MEHCLFLCVSTTKIPLVSHGIYHRANNKLICLGNYDKTNHLNGREKVMCSGWRKGLPFSSWALCFNQSGHSALHYLPENATGAGLKQRLVLKKRISEEFGWGSVWLPPVNIWCPGISTCSRWEWTAGLFHQGILKGSGRPAREVQVHWERDVAF